MASMLDAAMRRQLGLVLDVKTPMWDRMGGGGPGRGGGGRRGRTWCVMSGLASEMSRFILRMMPMCSSLLRREYFSSRWTPMWPGRECDDLYVSSDACDRTTIRRFESLSVGGMATCCSATS